MDKRVYWDSCCFIDYLEGTDRGRQVLGVLERAEEGEIQIVTSAIALTEVLGEKHASASFREKVRKAMGVSSGIMVVDLTRALAEDARDFIWDHEFHSHKQDGIHLATAMYVNNFKKIDEIHTFDKDLLSFNGKIGIPVIEPSLELYPSEPPLPLE